VVGAGGISRALQASVELGDDETIEVVFLLGEAAQALNTRAAAYGFRSHLPDSMVLVRARRANAP
jgi:hypothetical protein